MTGAPHPRCGIIMGSQSDWAIMRHAAETLDRLGVAHEARIVSAHRTPDRLVTYARTARERGIAVIIAGAGGAAHLPGMCAAWTSLPVLGVPVASLSGQSHALTGLDSLLSIVQMPAGIPVGTLAIGRAGAINAALLAAAILAGQDAALLGRLETFRAEQTAAIAEVPLPA
jgi:5-(carboxyamino)imidazole ribonucleotide mutase